MVQATTAAVWVQWLQKSPAQAATTVTPGPGAKLATQEGSSPGVLSAFSRQDADGDARQCQACDSPARDPGGRVPRRKGSGSRQTSVTEHAVPAPLAPSSRSGHRPYP